VTTRARLKQGPRELGHAEGLLLGAIRTSAMTSIHKILLDTYPAFQAI